MTMRPLILLLTCAASLALVGCHVERSSSGYRMETPVPVPESLNPFRPVSTYSIVARDPDGAFGVGVQSHWFSVGTVVPWAKSEVGAVATQSLADINYGPLGLQLMEGGRDAHQAMHALTSTDSGQAWRQVAMIDSEGNVATHTGELCIAEAGHITKTLADGSVISCQANMMHTTGVPEAMLAAYESFDGDLAERIMVALEAAQAAGGDIRGKQSASILTVRAESTGRPWLDVVININVEDDPNPLVELRRLLELHRAYEHMNAGDVAMEHGDVDAALREYASAQRLARDSAEMSFWTAVSLANAGRVEESMRYFRQAFNDDTPGADWRALLERLPDSDLWEADPALIKSILRDIQVSTN